MLMLGAIHRASSGAYLVDLRISLLTLAISVRTQRTSFQYPQLFALFLVASDLFLTLTQQVFRDKHHYNYFGDWEIKNDFMEFLSFP